MVVALSFSSWRVKTSVSCGNIFHLIQIIKIMTTKTGHKEERVAALSEM